MKCWQPAVWPGTASTDTQTAAAAVVLSGTHHESTTEEVGGKNWCISWCDNSMTKVTLTARGTYRAQSTLTKSLWSLLTRTVQPPGIKCHCCHHLSSSSATCLHHVPCSITQAVRSPCHERLLSAAGAPSMQQAADAVRHHWWCRPGGTPWPCKPCCAKQRCVKLLGWRTQSKLVKLRVCIMCSVVLAPT